MTLGCSTAAALTLALVLWLAPYASAQVAIEVLSSSDDPVGQRLIFAYKDSLLRSATFKPVMVTPTVGMVVYIVTMELASDAKDRATIYGITWTWHDPSRGIGNFYLAHTIGTCGVNRISYCAEGLVADTNTQFEKVYKTMDRQPSR
jgi:hypothetical protein